MIAEQCQVRRRLALLESSTTGLLASRASVTTSKLRVIARELDLLPPIVARLQNVSRIVPLEEGESFFRARDRRA
jgi:hypothetical protein